MPNFIHEITNNHKTNCIILSAGKNKTRGEKCAKSLTAISKNKRLIDTQIQVVSKVFKDVDILCAVGDQSKVLTNYILDKYTNVRVVENQKYNLTSPLDSLKLCLNCATCLDTCVIYGDKHFDADAITFDDYESPVIVESTNDSFSKDDIGLVYQNNTLKNISYGVKKKWGQIFYIPRNKFNDFRKKINNLSKKYYNIFDVINSVAKDYEFKIHKTKHLKEI